MLLLRLRTSSIKRWKDLGARPSDRAPRVLRFAVFFLRVLRPTSTSAAATRQGSSINQATQLTRRWADHMLVDREAATWGSHKHILIMLVLPAAVCLQLRLSACLRYNG